MLPGFRIPVAGRAARFLKRSASDGFSDRLRFASCNTLMLGGRYGLTHASGQQKLKASCDI